MRQSRLALSVGVGQRASRAPQSLSARQWLQHSQRKHTIPRICAYLQGSQNVFRNELHTKSCICFKVVDGQNVYSEIIQTTICKSFAATRQWRIV